MTGHEVAENLRTTKLHWTAGVLHKNVNGVDYFCVLGMKAFEAGVPIKRLDFAWNFSSIAEVYVINDTAASPEHSSEARKQACIDAFDSPLYRNVNFPVEEFIQYLKDTTQ